MIIARGARFVSSCGWRLKHYNAAMIWRPWTFFAVVIAGWMNRRQQEVIEYLREENRILREKLGRKRILLSVGQKRRLAIKGKAIGRNLLRQFGTLFSPDTIEMAPMVRGPQV